jgi:hypothetical protein
MHIPQSGSEPLRQLLDLFGCEIWVLRFIWRSMEARKLSLPAAMTATNYSSKSTQLQRRNDGEQEKTREVAPLLYGV